MKLVLQKITNLEKSYEKLKQHDEQDEKRILHVLDQVDFISRQITMSP